MATSNPSKDRNLLAVIGDEVCYHFEKLVLSRTSLCFRTQSQAFFWQGLGRSRRTRRTSLSSSLVRNLLRRGHQRQMCFPETEIQSIEATFSEYTEREDIAILLINQHVRLPSDQLRL
jgi:hypothetical protein